MVTYAKRLSLGCETDSPIPVTSGPSPTSNSGTDFVRELVKADEEAGTFAGRVQTRFPPEPNGYLHIGHAKAITLDFGLAEEAGGTCKLRFDDTNPVTEDHNFADGILEDLRWLGYEPAEVVYASDYFDQLYEWAQYLVTRVLRAKIDMQHDNMQMRDPIMYRIRKVPHFRTGDTWCIYPTYDWAHGQSDAIEGVTHSLCTLEFDSHRDLYNWYLAQLPLPGDQPRQTEFARLELTHTVTSKRRLAGLVADSTVDGWDDPRLPTLRALRRRGYPQSRFVTSAATSAFLAPTAATRSNYSSRSSAPT